MISLLYSRVETMSETQDTFMKRVSRGRRFEEWELSKWNKPEHKDIEIQAPLAWKGKRGRADLRLIDTKEGHTILVEIKASDWDKMAAHRVRPNALRHARQIWRYINAELADRPVLPAIVYPCEPQSPSRRAEIESILHERFIQVVWRELGIDSL